MAIPVNEQDRRRNSAELFPLRKVLRVGGSRGSMNGPQGGPPALIDGVGAHLPPHRAQLLAKDVRPAGKDAGGAERWSGELQRGARALVTEHRPFEPE